MKLSGLYILALFFMSSCAGGGETPVEPEVPKNYVLEDFNNEIETMDFDQFNEDFLNRKDGKVYVVNFWATWCGPCIRELPQFEEVSKLYNPEEVKVVLVTLDMAKHKESKLIPYVKDNNLRSEVVHLDDPNMNRWIPMVDEDWSGAIPATIFYQNERREFIEGSFENGQLIEKLNEFKN